VIIIAYRLAFHLRYGATLGKMAMRLSVVTVQESASANRVLRLAGRDVPYAVSLALPDSLVQGNDLRAAVVLLLQGAWMVVDVGMMIRRPSSSLHDVLASTRVVCARE
jgi:uncharacterized RDD family membrane protein YckC